MVRRAQGARHRRDRRGNGAFGRVFDGVCARRRRGVWHPGLSRAVGDARAAALRRGGGRAAKPAGPAWHKAGCRAGLPAPGHGAVRGLQALPGRGRALRAAGAALQPGYPLNRSGPRPAGKLRPALRCGGVGGFGARKARLPGAQRQSRPQTRAAWHLRRARGRVGVVRLCRRVVARRSLCGADLLLQRRRGRAAGFEYRSVRPAARRDQLRAARPGHERRQFAELRRQPAAADAGPLPGGRRMRRRRGRLLRSCKTFVSKRYTV